MPVVTISSQFGAGARHVGRRIADRLQLQYVDQAVLVDAARQLGVSLTSVARHDERTDSFRERLGHFLQRALERSATGGSVDPLIGAGHLELLLAQSFQEVTEGATPSLIDDRAYLETITHIITDLGARGDVVIIGRGGQMILRDHPHTAHVQLVADEDLRLQRFKQWEGLADDDVARRRMRDFNRSRTAFHKKFWKVDVWDPRLYDLVINTTRLTFDEAVEIAVPAVKAATASDRTAPTSPTAEA